jgi:hypothetical protein
MNDRVYYFAGYSIECALRVCTARGSLRHEFGDKRISYNRGQSRAATALPVPRQLKSLLRLWEIEITEYFDG